MSQQENNKMQQHFYRASAADFKKIPGSPVLYSASEKLFCCFDDLDSMKSIADCRAGLTTGDNTIFQREWMEVQYSKICLFSKEKRDAIESAAKWFPCSSGGGFRKWYGNHETIVNWESDGFAIRSFAAPDGRLKASPRSMDYYFRDGFTWGKISSGYFSPRYLPTGFIFDDTGQSAFPREGANKFLI